MRLAHARVRAVQSLAPEGGPEVALVRTNEAGQFSIATLTSGGIMLELSGSEHVQQQLYLRVYPGYRLTVNARLARIRYLPSPDSARVVGDFNNFRTDTSARLLQHQRDGIWTVDIASKKDSIVYALVGVRPRGPVVNASSHHDVRTSDDEYRSVAIVREGSARIEFDPARIVRDTLAAKVAYSGGAAARAARLSDSIQAHSALAGNAERAQKPLLPSTWKPLVQRVTRELAAEREPSVREMLLFELLNIAHLGGYVPPSIGRIALRELPPSAPAWRTVTSLMDDLSNEAMVVADSVIDAVHPNIRPMGKTPADSARLRRYANHLVARTDSMLTSETNDAMRAQLLFWLMEATRKWLPERATLDLNRMRAELPDDFITKMALQRYGDTGKLRANALMPAFDFMMLADTTQRITNAKLAGKTVLIDFWATWCTPCLGEMSTLHDAYEKFHSRGLEILSVSADVSTSDVARFRREKWPMPWQHGWVENGIWSNEFKALEISGIPRVVLVGPDGRILGVDGALRGGALQKTLERIFK